MSLRPSDGPLSKRAQAGPPKGRKRRRLGESAGGRERREQWQAERDAHLAKHPRCQFWEHARSRGLMFSSLWSERCWGRVDVHHTRPRSMGGTRGETGPLISLCRRHHDETEQHRLEARELGLLVRREVWR